VSSGEEAVDFLKNNQADLVLLDMVMEPGINGRETFGRIIQDNPGQKAIIVSGYSENEDIKQVMEMGVLSLLKKPYTMEEIGRAVQTALQC
jgi:YesN/AraC family two-component response regulator